ncbi:MAG: hypothetical protein ACC618_00395 [Patescibacteria group bacterium]
MTEIKKEKPSEPPETSELPPWKQVSKSKYETDARPYLTIEKKPSNKKWIIITIFLLIVTNTLTAAYFLNKGRATSPQSGSSYNPFVPNYSGAISRANDTTRRADLASISTALNQYMVEYGPDKFPTEKQCIGSSAGCFDLASLLVPFYLQSLPTDPTTGTEVGTGYSFYWDEAQGFILEALSENGQPITIVR